MLSAGFPPTTSQVGREEEEGTAGAMTDVCEEAPIKGEREENVVAVVAAVTVDD